MSKAKQYPVPFASWWTACQRYEVVDLGYGTPCWRWLLSLSEGYGQVVLGRDGRRISCCAHRLFYEREFGPVPVDLHLDHLCRNRACVNPAHLEPVTPRENALRAARLRTHCKHGHPFDEANTYWTPGGTRDCRACRRMHQRAYYARSVAA